MDPTLVLAAVIGVVLVSFVLGFAVRRRRARSYQQALQRLADRRHGLVTRQTPTSYPRLSVPVGGTTFTVSMWAPPTQQLTRLPEPAGMTVRVPVPRPTDTLRARTRHVHDVDVHADDDLVVRTGERLVDDVWLVETHSPRLARAIFAGEVGAALVQLGSALEGGLELRVAEAAVELRLFTVLTDAAMLGEVLDLMTRIHQRLADA